jgi:hypothetical protein
MLTVLSAAILTCAALGADKPDRFVGDRPALVCIEVAMRAPRYGVPVALAVTTAWAESHLCPDAVGTAGEIGPMQCHPGYHETCAADPVGTGLQVLARRLSEQGGDWHAATCRYTGDGPRCTRGRAAMALRLVAMVTP